MNDEALTHATYCEAVVDASDRFLWLNRVAESANGISTRDLRGIRIDTLWPDDEEYCQIRWQVRRTGEAARLIRPVQLLTGTSVWFDIAFRPRPNGYVRLICRDVSDAIQLASHRTLLRLLNEPRRAAIPPHMGEVARLALAQCSAKEISVALGMSVDAVAAALVQLAR